jgi:hypothetical protein
MPGRRPLIARQPLFSAIQSQHTPENGSFGRVGGKIAPDGQHIRFLGCLRFRCGRRPIDRIDRPVADKGDASH